MKKNSKKNQKGSVLFTVICFTTVLMILTTTALSVSSYANKVSTTNVKSTQAQITAQNCLDSYLETFLDASTGKYDYSEIAKIADNDDGGHYEASPYEFTVSMSGGSANVGDCKIKIFKSSSSGYVVKCEATYGGKTESASAFFDGKVVKNYQSENAVETIGGVTSSVNFTTDGDVLVESKDEKDVFVAGIGSQSAVKGNFVARCNLMIGQFNDVPITDTVDEKAPTLKTLGYLFFTGSKINTLAGKSQDASGNYTNEDGYMYSDKKIIFARKNALSIGEESKPIDVYSHGIYFGYVPKFAPDFNDIKSVANLANTKYTAGYPAPTDENPTQNLGQDFDKTINGNVYSYKSSGNNNGDVYISIDNNAGINGDLVVDGDIYLVKGTKFTVTGNLYCTGNIKIMSSDGTVSEQKSALDLNGANDYGLLHWNGSISNIKPSDARAQMPNLTFESMTKQYTVATPNDMFIDNNDDSNHLGDKYREAYSKVTSSNWMEYLYADSACTRSFKTIYDEDHNKLRNEVSSGSYIYIKDNVNFKSIVDNWNYLEGIDKYKFVIKMNYSEDRYILLPADSSNLDFTVDYSNSEIVKSVPTNFCYFMLECGSAGDYYNTTSPVACSWTMSKTSIWDNRSDMNNYVPTKDKVNNTFILVPNNCTLSVKAEWQKHKLKSVIYGPAATLVADGGGPEKLIYGQVIVNNYVPGTNKTIITSCLPSPGSILKYIDSKSPSDGAVQFQYYIKHKS